MRLVPTEWEMEDNRDIRITFLRGKYSAVKYPESGWEGAQILINRHNPSWGDLSGANEEAKYSSLLEVYQAVLQAGLDPIG